MAPGKFEKLWRVAVWREGILDKDAAASCDAAAFVMAPELCCSFRIDFKGL